MSEKRSDGAYVRIYNRKEFIMAMTLHMNTDETIESLVREDKTVTSFSMPHLEEITNQNIPTMCSERTCGKFATHILHHKQYGVELIIPLCNHHALQTYDTDETPYKGVNEGSRIKRMEITHEYSDGRVVKNTSNYDVGWNEDIEVTKEELVGGNSDGF